MNTKIITAIALATLLTSCSSLYKATSTPDDIYYSPSPAVQAKNANSSDDAGYDVYENYQSSNDDRYLRMKVRNNALWSTIDDYDYWQDSRYDFGFSCNASRYALLSSSLYNPLGYYGMYSSWNPLYGFGLGYGYYGFGGGGYWGSPYQTVVLYKNPKTYFGSTSKSNLTAYRNFQYSNNNFYKNQNNNRYNNSNYLNPNNYTNRNNTYYNNNTNTYQPSRSFSTSSSSNSAGGRSGGFNSSGSSSAASRPTHH